MDVSKPKHIYDNGSKLLYSVVVNSLFFRILDKHVNYRKGDKKWI